jgi:hypothetical protein
MSFEWPYYTLRKDGTLVHEDGHVVGGGRLKFDSVAEAERWLEQNDERGTVRAVLVRDRER